MGRIVTDLTGKYDPARDVRREMGRDFPSMPQTERRGGLDVAIDPKLAQAGYNNEDFNESESGILLPHSEEEKGVPREKAASITRADEKVTRYLVLAGLGQNMQVLTMLPRLLANPHLQYDAIICFGGLGQETAQLGLLFTLLANNLKKRSVYAIPSASETMDVWEKAVEGAREQGNCDNLFNMVAYDPRVKSDNHTLLFIPGSSKPFVRNGYVVVSDSEPTTQTIKRKEEGTRTRVLNLDEYLNGIDIERASRYIVVCADTPKLEGEQAIDYQEVIDIKDSSGVIKYKGYPAHLTERAIQLGFTVESRKENSGDKKLLEALRKSCIEHVLCAGIPETSQKSSDNEGKPVGQGYAERRYHNATGLNDGWLSMLEVVETPEQCDENARKMPSDYGLKTRVTPLHIMHTMR